MPLIKPGFPLGWVHDVVWAPPVRGLAQVAQAPHQTFSVHSYSPPLTAMSYYEVIDRNRLRRRGTELMHQP
jgi:hypothetical protein